MSDIDEAGPKISAEAKGEKRQPSSWRRLLLGPVPWVVISFGLLQIIEKALHWVNYDTIKTISEINDKLGKGAGAVQPWQGAAIFWTDLSTNWPADLSTIGIPFFLLGRIVSGGLDAIAVPLSAGWETALPALVGYGLGLYITWMIFADSRGHLNLIICIVGIILVGGLCLMVLRGLMANVDGYVWLVPYVKTRGVRFLKTIIPSRKATRDYLS